MVSSITLVPSARHRRAVMGGCRSVGNRGKGPVLTSTARGRVRQHAWIQSGPARSQAGGHGDVDGGAHAAEAGILEDSGALESGWGLRHHESVLDLDVR